jgi:hypothetical protein
MVKSSPIIKEATVEEIIHFFESTGKKILSFIGYSGSGYEDNNAMWQLAEQILDEFSPDSTIVNIGATSSGIGAIYEFAKKRNFTTTGVVSTLAKEYGVELSPYLDYAFYVADQTWGGYLEGGSQLSPTSKVMVEISDELIGIGGGEIGRDELTAAKRAGKEVRFFPADMNHKKSIQKAQRKGLPIPTEFRGAAGEIFKEG